MSNNNNNMSVNRIERIKNTVQSFPDFPKTGILFRDLFPILRDPNIFHDLINELIDHIKSNYPQTEAIIGLESRGFLIGPVLALQLNIPFIPIRKKGKLPGNVKSVSYALEYGNDSFEIQCDAIKSGMKCLIFDDLIATGGSLTAAIQLINECGGHIIECIVIMELSALKGRDNISVPLYSMLQYD